MGPLKEKSKGKERMRENNMFFLLMKCTFFAGQPFKMNSQMFLVLANYEEKLVNY